MVKKLVTLLFQIALVLLQILPSTTDWVEYDISGTVKCFNAVNKTFDPMPDQHVALYRDGGFRFWAFPEKLVANAVTDAQGHFNVQGSMMAKNGGTDTEEGEVVESAVLFMAHYCNSRCEVKSSVYLEGPLLNVTIALDGFSVSAETADGKLLKAGFFPCAS